MKYNSLFNSENSYLKDCLKDLENEFNLEITYTIGWGLTFPDKIVFEIRCNSDPFKDNFVTYNAADYVVTSVSYIDMTDKLLRDFHDYLFRMYDSNYSVIIPHKIKNIQCPNCGASLEPEQKVCKYCRTNFNWF